MAKKSQKKSEEKSHELFEIVRKIKKSVTKLAVAMMTPINRRVYGIE